MLELVVERIFTVNTPSGRVKAGRKMYMQRRRKTVAVACQSAPINHGDRIVSFVSSSGTAVSIRRRRGAICDSTVLGIIAKRKEQPIVPNIPGDCGFDRVGIFEFADFPQHPSN